MIRSAQRPAPPGALAPTRGFGRPLLALGMHTHGRAAGALLLAAVAFYYPLVLLGRVLVDYDAFVYFYPQRAYLGHALLSGRLPLWDPALFMGAPFLANPQTAVLYPPSWLFVLGPVEAVYNVQLVLHAFLAALFMYLFARCACRARPVAATLGGLAYAFGGFAVGQQGHLNQISAAAWLPAVLLGYDRFAATRRVSWIALGALALALQLLAGHPQETYMTLIVLGLYGVVTAPWRVPRRLAANAVAGAGLCLLGAGLAAAQLLPSLELTPLSIRGQGVDWRDAVAGSLPSYLAVRALLPPYWLDVPNTEFLGYAGVIPVVLGGLALLGGRGRAVVFGALVCGLGIFLALGENNAAYAWVFESVPGFDTFRAPARWLLLWQFGSAVLAALGAEWIGRGARLDPRRWQLWPRVLVVVLVLTVGLAWQRDMGEPFAQRRTPFAIAALAGATLAIGALPHVGRPALAVGLLAVLTGGEMWAAGNASPARQSPPPAYSSGLVTEWLRAHGVGDDERLLSLARPEYVPASENAVRAQLGGLPASMVQSVLVAQKWHDTLTPNVPMQFGLASADGYDGGVLPLRRWLDLSGLVVRDPRPDGVLLTRLEDVPEARILDLLGVRYVVANAGTPGRPDLQVIDLGDLRLFVRPEAVPRSAIVHAAEPVADDAAALARMASPTWDPTRELVLAGPGTLGSAATHGSPAPTGPDATTTPAPATGGATAAGAPSTGRVASTPGAASGIGLPTSAAGATATDAVRVDAQQPERWRGHVSLAEPGYLLQREAWYPGWRARVDGREASVLRADVLFRAVPLEAGEHDVEVYFDPASLKRGALLSGLAVLLSLALLAWPRWGRRVWATAGGRLAGATRSRPGARLARPGARPGGSTTPPSGSASTAVGSPRPIERAVQNVATRGELGADAAGGLG